MSATSSISLLPRLSGPRWVAAHQHRTTGRVFGGFVAVSFLAVAAFLAVSAGADPKADFAQSADTGMTMLLQRVAGAGMLLPALVGAFVAGPLVARELESGTYTWLWTQSVSPVRWLATKLALVSAVTLSGTAVLVVLFRLARGALSAEAQFSLSWYDTAYEMLGPVQVAMCALGIGVGALVGLLVRKTVPAMVVAGITVLTVAWVFTGLLRKSLWPVETLVSKTPIESLHTPAVWDFADGMLTASGTRVLTETCWGTEGVGKTPEQCMADLGGVQYFADVHPESHFWPLQLIESGLLLVLAGLAVAVAFRVLRGRHAGAS
ncbi:hypothetical protein GCM10010329_18420 [Streptomyces spiroverticillatus]|uniref:ABC transporter permease n=1 Tax=Streptomyces finlayi TaxID=67296 RepID=A0A918WTT8_9ACTN|nr:ABC transporter permease [Streptomyces finlayi]GGZ97437.1 hypothetical protein GCM10010329_18420 [Streptomyces spiroverticillatus]GHC82571.1 hypothetical protein GCM10010334_10900 [Streptomyces finlayi]